MCSDFRIICRHVDITGIFAEAADAACFTSTSADLQAVCNAGMHSFGVVALQQPCCFREIFVRAGAHGIHQVVILFPRQIRLNLADFFLVLQQGDQFNRALPHQLEIQQILGLIHLEKCAQNIGFGSLFKATATSQFSMQLKRTGEIAGRNQCPRPLTKGGEFTVDSSRIILSHRELFPGAC